MVPSELTSRSDCVLFDFFNESPKGLYENDWSYVSLCKKEMPSTGFNLNPDLKYIL